MLAVYSFLHEAAATRAWLALPLPAARPPVPDPIPAGLPSPPCRAGAHAIDIRNALKGHPYAEEMPERVGPDPEPEAAAEPAAEAEADQPAAKEQPKGLPALGPKPSKKKAEA